MYFQYTTNLCITYCNVIRFMISKSRKMYQTWEPLSSSRKHTIYQIADNVELWNFLFWLGFCFYFFYYFLWAIKVVHRVKLILIWFLICLAVKTFMTGWFMIIFCNRVNANLIVKYINFLQLKRKWVPRIL